MSNNFKKVNPDNFENIKNIFEDISKLQSEFQLTREQSEDIDNYVLQLHRDFVAEKKKKPFWLIFSEYISNFFKGIEKFGILKPAIALGVIIIAVTTFFIFYSQKSSYPIATNLKDTQTEKIIETQQTFQEKSENTTNSIQAAKKDSKKVKNQLALVEKTQIDFIEKNGLSSEQFSLFKPEEIANLPAFKDEDKKAILERSFDLKYDTLISKQYHERADFLIKTNSIDTDTKTNHLISKIITEPNIEKNISLDDLIFDGKYYKTQWKQLTFENKPINFKVRTVYFVDKNNNITFIKYEYQKTEKIDTTLETFKLETTGIQLDSLLKMQE